MNLQHQMFTLAFCCTGKVFRCDEIKCKTHEGIRGVAVNRDPPLLD